jgi:hypothetical protein
LLVLYIVGEPMTSPWSMGRVATTVRDGLGSPQASPIKVEEAQSRQCSVPHE